MPCVLLAWRDAGQSDHYTLKDHGKSHVTRSHWNPLQDFFKSHSQWKGSNGRPPPTVCNNPSRITIHVMNHTCWRKLLARKVMEKYKSASLLLRLLWTQACLKEHDHFRSQAFSCTRKHAGVECAPRLFQEVNYVDIPVPWFSLWVWCIDPVALGRISLLCNL